MMFENKTAKIRTALELSKPYDALLQENINLFNLEIFFFLILKIKSFHKKNDI